MNNHNDFILSPITDILEDVVIASAGIGNGIETYPLCDYIMQSVFLKMTGFQEQKMKCICWELASNDYDYRYKKFSQKSLGECSCYDEKNTIYRDLIWQIKKYISNFKVLDSIDKINILITTKSKIKDIFSDTNLLILAQSDFNEYENIINGIKDDCFAETLENKQANKKTYFLLSDCSHCSKNWNNKKIPKCSNINNLKDMYDILYNHRNKCAHNTKSYQQNLPTLKTLADENYRYENYFVWFVILILIDKIFIELYSIYQNILEDKI